METLCPVFMGERIWGDSVKNVCHLTTAHDWNDTRIFKKECISLSNSQLAVHLVAPGDIQMVQDGVHIHGVNFPSHNRLLRMMLMSWLVTKAAVNTKSDIYHFHDPELLPCALLLKGLGKKVIYDVHEDVPRQILSKSWIYKPMRKIVSRVFEMFEEWASRKFDAIIPATPTIADRFNKINNRVVCVNNYAILEDIPTDIDESCEKGIYVCYTGAISDIRGIRQMIEAIEHTSAKLLLAGAFSCPDLYKEVTATPGWDKVIYLGEITRDEVKEVMRRSVTGLVLYHPEPNHIYSQPTKMYEYMSMRIPLVVSDFSSWRKMADKYNCGICVNPFDICGIASAIQSYIDNPGIARDMGLNGRRAIEADFNWDNEEKKLLLVYEEILK